MRVLITGISGFVGPHLRQELQQHGCDVVGLDKTGNRPDVHSCDLTDARAVNDFFKKESFDWIIHLAALTSVAESWKSPDRFLEINVRMTENIYGALINQQKKTSVLIVSSSDVYGPQKEYPITEDSLPNPQNPYAKSKLAQEQAALRHTGITTIVSRAFNHAGPGASAFLSIPSFAKQIATCERNNQNEIVVGNLESYRDFTDVRDVVQAYRLILEKGKPSNIYNICSGKKRKISDVLNQLIALSNVQISIRKNPDLMRPSDVPEFWGSYGKLHDDTGWEPFIPFEKTLADTLEYWRNQI